MTGAVAHGDHEATKVFPFSGILDSQAGRTLRHEVNEALAAGHLTILVDFQATTYVDSDGFSSLVACLKTTGEAGGKLSLRGLKTHVRMITMMSSNNRIFDVFKDEDVSSAKKP